MSPARFRPIGHAAAGVTAPSRRRVRCRARRSCAGQGSTRAAGTPGDGRAAADRALEPSSPPPSCCPPGGTRPPLAPPASLGRLVNGAAGGEPAALGARVPSRQGGCLGWPPPAPPPKAASASRKSPCGRRAAVASRSPPAPRARSWAPPPLTTLPPPRPPLRWRGLRCAADTSSTRRAGGARVSRNPQPRTLISPQPSQPPPTTPARNPPPPPPLPTSCYDPPSFVLVCRSWFPIRRRFTATAIRGCLLVCTASRAPPPTLCRPSCAFLALLSRPRRIPSPLCGCRCRTNDARIGPALTVTAVSLAVSQSPAPGLSLDAPPAAPHSPPPPPPSPPSLPFAPPPCHHGAPGGHCSRLGGAPAPGGGGGGALPGGLLVVGGSRRRRPAVAGGGCRRGRRGRHRRAADDAVGAAAVAETGRPPAGGRPAAPSAGVPDAAASGADFVSCRWNVRLVFLIVASSRRRSTTGAGQVEDERWVGLLGERPLPFVC